MGKVIVPIRVQNWGDLFLLGAGVRAEPARTVRAEAVVDTGATNFYLRGSLIRQLGLSLVGERTSRTMSNRRERRRVYSPVELEIQGRTCHVDVVEVPEDLPNLVGQVPLELLDWVVDLTNRRLIGNPEHGGQHMFEEFFTSSPPAHLRAEKRWIVVCR